MAKVILICGKICSGKTYLANELKEEYNAVILSTDEVTFDLINNRQGEDYNEFAEKVNLYLRKKAVEFVKVGCNIILDWGFWSKKYRREIADYFKANNIQYEWHYMDIEDKTWYKNIEERNKKVLAGEGGCSFYVDEGLLNKVIEKFEIPEKEEMDVIHNITRKV